MGALKQEVVGDKHRISDLSHKCAIARLLSKVLIIKIADDEVVTISLFQRQEYTTQNSKTTLSRVP